MIGVFVGFSRIFLLGILIFKGLTARRLYKSFGVKGLKIHFAEYFLPPVPVDSRKFAFLMVSSVYLQYGEIRRYSLYGAPTAVVTIDLHRS
jgi:hypothetical protein